MATDNQLQEFIVNEVETDDRLAKLSQTETLGPNQLFVTKDGSTASDNAVGLPIGAIFASAIPIIDARVHLLDGSTISQYGIYEEFSALIKNLIATGQPINCSQKEFDEDIISTGNCGKFVIDNDNGTIRLPRITKFIQGVDNISNIGKSLLDEFKSHTHIQNAHQHTIRNPYTNTGANQVMIPSTAGTASATDNSYSWTPTGNTTATNQNTGGEETRPKATQYPYYIVLASGYKSNKSLNIDNIMNEINSLSNDVANVLSVKNILDRFYPVGSIYITVNNHGSPASIFGGTWEQIKGRFLLGAGANDANTTTTYGNLSASAINRTTVGEMGGEVYHTLQTSEIPSHYHYVGAGANDSTGYHAGGSKVGHIGIWNATGYGRNSDSTGGGGAHNNIPPYYVVYIYKRVG